jgi:hypothetical protein
VNALAVVLVWVAMCLLVGCAGGSQTEDFDEPEVVCHRTFYIRSGFTENQERAIANAARRWNAVAAEKFCVESSDTKAGSVIRPIVFESPEYIAIRDHFKRDFGGAWWFEDHDVIVIRIDPDDVWFEAIAMHEFGHAHMLQHIPEPGIMNADDVWHDFTAGDIAECKRVGAC